ncbi:MAG: DUF2846 domain-containing protein [Flavisolibacter sp.]
MKNLIAIAFVFFCFSFSPAPGKNSTPVDDATIYIYQSGQVNAASKSVLYIDNRKMCQLSSSRYISLTVSKGKHTISSKEGTASAFKKELNIEIDAEAGKSYYIEYKIKPGATRAKLELQLVNKDIADKQMVGLTGSNCQ